MTGYMYDAAYAPSLAECKRKGGVAMSHYMTRSFASTSAQPAATRAAGMGAVFNWEGAATELVGASRARGRQIAAEALGVYPAAAPRAAGGIYYSVDTDLTDLSVCDEVFRGINDVHKATGIPVKTYAEGGLIERLHALGLVQGKQWLSMSEGFGDFQHALKSGLVAVVQMHDAAGNWIGSDVPGTDRNTVIDAAALGAWWPTGSPAAITGDGAEEMALSPQAQAQVTQIVAAQFSRFFATAGPDGKLVDHSLLALINQSVAAHAAAQAQTVATATLTRVAALQKQVDDLHAAVSAAQAAAVQLDPMPVTGTVTFGGAK